MGDQNSIRVRGARVHNLQDVDVDLPRDRFVVLTGVSGSGKSSLAFDTLYAEGQRRYIESLSSYARQFLDQLERPDVDLIEGLPPTVSIRQSVGATNPRSTVSTITEVHDYLRLLYARTGLPHCPSCGQSIRRQTPEQMMAHVLAMKEGRKVMILAPLVKGRKGAHAEAFQTVRRAGLLRARVDGEILEITRDDPKLAKTKLHQIDVVVDRLVIREGIRPRLEESLGLALKLGQGTILLSAQTDSTWVDEPLSLILACPACGIGLEEIEPRTFSFNSPHGACPECDGLGSVPFFDPDLILPDRSLSLEEGAVQPWNLLEAHCDESLLQEARNLLRSPRLKASTPLVSWPPAALAEFLNGRKGARGTPGLLLLLERAYQGARSDRARQRFEVYRSRITCPSCQGSRLRREARGVTVGGLSLPDVAALAITEARTVIESWSFTSSQEEIGPPLVRAIVARLAFLEQVGLGYLTLARGADTLSGGELQRVQLATQLGSGLVGVCYVLDEPTAGLHPGDTEKLLTTLTGLRDQGNSVIVVEHDELTIRAADWLIDLGPGAGPDGGRVVAEGPPERLVESGPSSTAGFLRGEWTIPCATTERLDRSPGTLRIRNASERNLKSIDVEIPLGTFTCVSGVSGSGKSTLVHEVLARELKRRLSGRPSNTSDALRMEGLDAIDKLIVIDQTPIGRSPRSTPATYTGLYDEIRRIFSQTREAKLRGYKANRFSFNTKGGRCERCQGQGMRRGTMNFLPDLYIRCETCAGKRFNRQTLEVRFKSKSIGDVLEMRVDESRVLFDSQPKVKRQLDALHGAGLGYVTLGQSSTTLSGGEAQRVKLAAEVGRPATGRTLYLLDEPTLGLHFQDVARLLQVLNRLSDLGNTVVAIEHNLDVLKSADWLIDLGPGGGSEGGRLLAMGPPRVVAEVQESVTGRYLRSALARP
ncbi:MAG: excinuclease ABC subunit UvrA [Isosphaeraceae bacterium]